MVEHKNFDICLYLNFKILFFVIGTVLDVVCHIKLILLVFLQ